MTGSSVGATVWPLISRLMPSTLAARCLSCGAAKVDPKLCIGCGLCTLQCKFDAIHLDRTADAWGVPYEQLVPTVLKEEAKKIVRIVNRKIKA